MKIINFEEAKARMQPKEKGTEHLSEIDKDILEMQKQYQEYAEYCNRWYDEHVLGQDKNGNWIYKDL